MPTSDDGVIRHLLQALEQSLEVIGNTSAVAGQLLEAHQTGTPLAPPTLSYYEERLATLAGQSAQLKDAIARWWMILEETKH